MTVEYVDIDEIEFDVENPRIRMSLEKFRNKENITEEHIYYALRYSVSNGGASGNTEGFSKLKTSIQASRGITQPIKIIEREGKKVCIDGNTRLAIYKKLRKEEDDKAWSKIKAEIVKTSDQSEIDKIRITAHLVGAREWPAYEKAAYLHMLRNKEHMSRSAIVEIAGGNEKEIDIQIDAYNDMNEYYRDKVGDASFKIDRFSGYVELQKPKVRQSIHDADFDEHNFADWIHKGMIYRLADVRNLPKVLGDDEAREEFLSGGERSIERAMAIVQEKERNKIRKTKVDMETATIYQLATVLTQRIANLPFDETNELRKREDVESENNLEILQGLSSKVQELLDNVSE